MRPWSKSYVRRKREALAAARARDVKFGNPNGAAALRRDRGGGEGLHKAVAGNADAFAQDLVAVVNDIREEGLSRSGPSQPNRRSAASGRGDAARAGLECPHPAQTPMRKTAVQGAAKGRAPIECMNAPAAAGTARQKHPSHSLPMRAGQPSSPALETRAPNARPAGAALNGEHCRVRIYCRTRPALSWRSTDPRCKFDRCQSIWRAWPLTVGWRNASFRL